MAWSDFLDVPQKPFPTYIKVTGLRRPSMTEQPYVSNDDLRERVTEAVTLEIQELLGDRVIISSRGSIPSQDIYLEDLGANGYACGQGRVAFLARGDSIRNPLQVRVIVEVVG